MDAKKTISRTSQQNKALHKMFEELAGEMLSHGLDMKAIVSKQNLAVPPSKENVKELIWKPLQHALYGTTSTTKLTTAQVDKVFEIIQKIMAEEGLDIQFPSIEHYEQFKENIG